MARRADGSWLFVGESGALFEAADALAPFTRTVPAPEPLAKVAGAGAVVLATTLEGRLLRWERPRRGGAGPALGGARVFDVAVGEAGKALALAFPEALFTSEDGGATWAPTGAPRRRRAAARRARRRASSARRGSSSRSCGGRRLAPFARGREKSTRTQAALEVEVGRAPSRRGVQAGARRARRRSLLRGGRGPSRGRALAPRARAHRGAARTAEPLAWSEACGSMRLGARRASALRAGVPSPGGRESIRPRRRKEQRARAPPWGPARPLTPDTDQIASPSRRTAPRS